MTATLHLRLGTAREARDLYSAAYGLAQAHTAPTIDAEMCAAWLAGSAPPPPPCRACAGLGRWDDTPCSVCEGTGRAS